MRLFWSGPARRDLDRIWSYVNERDPRAADAMEDRVLAAVSRLPATPRLGRPGRVAGTRELIVPRTPLLVVYRHEFTDLVVLRVLHHAMEWPPDG